MINNYYTLFRQVREYRPLLQDARLLSCFSQTKDILHLEWITVSRQVIMMEISVLPASPYWLIREPFSRKKKNTVDLFESAMGKRIRDIQIISFNRVIGIRFDDATYLVVELFGTPNVYHLNETGMIIHAFDNQNEKAGQVYSYYRDLISDVSSGESIEGRLLTIDTVEELKIQLSKGFLAFNKYLYMEWLCRTSGSGDSANSSAGQGKTVLTDMCRELFREDPRIYYRDEEPVLLSLAVLSYLSDADSSLSVQTYPSLNDCLRFYLIRKQKLEHESRLRNVVLKAATQRLKKNEILVLALHKDIQRAEQYKTWENMGHLLTSNFTLIRKGMDTISLTDPYDPDSVPVIIPLNPDLPPQENISRLFAKSKKLKQSVEKIRKRIQEIQREIDSLQIIRQQMETRPYPPSDRIEKIYQDFLKRRWIAVETIKTKQHKKILTGDELFKSFILEGRWKVWVGQNDQKNDQLTFGYAGKDDYWFHARGVPGSHIILRKEQRTDNPPKSVMEATAAIAAFFSKAKTSALVPVIMTQKKYVRKMKKGKPGQVIVERETVIMVEPHNPEIR